MARKELYINNTLVDTFEDEPYSLNYQITDVTSPEKRNSSFSKTIRLPGTKTNNIFFTHIFDVTKSVNQSDNGNFSPDFNPNKSAPVTLFSDSVAQFKGVARLVQINVLNGVIQDYEIIISGQQKNLFKLLNDLLLTDIDMSEFNHAFTRTNIKDSWDTQIQKNGGNYNNFTGSGTDTFSNGQPNGEGYYYPLIDYGYHQNPLKFPIKNLYPAFYVKQYIDKIFGLAGFTYASRFFESNLFKKLIIPYNGSGDVVTASFKSNNEFQAGLSSDQIEQLGSGSRVTIIPDDDSTGANFDPNEVFDTATGNFSPNDTSSYNFTAVISFDYTLLGNPPVSPSARFELFFVKTNEVGTSERISTSQKTVFVSTTSGTVTETIDAVNFKVKKGEKVEVSIYFHSIFSLLLQIKQCDFSNALVSVQVQEGGTLPINSVIPKNIKITDFIRSIITAFNLYIDVNKEDPTNLIIEPAGNFYQVLDSSVEQITNGEFTTDLSNWTSTPTTGSSLSWSWVSGEACVTTTDSLELTEALVQQVSLIEDFEYTVSFDVVNAGGATVIPYFLTNIGESNQQVIYAEPLFSTSKTVTFVFTAPYNTVNIGIQIDHQSDDEGGESLCIDNVSVVGGQFNVKSLNWTKKRDTSFISKIKIASEIKGKQYKFSYEQDADYYNDIYREKYGEVYGNRSEEIDNDFVSGETEFKLIFSSTPLVGNLTNDLVVPRIVKLNENDLSVSPFESKLRILIAGGVITSDGTYELLSDTGDGEVLSDYGYAGHLDHPYTPTFDLLFDVPKEIFWGTDGNIGQAYVTNNLFNKYYFQFIEEITSKDAKIITNKYRLTVSDIYNLDFRNLIYDMDSLWRLQNINDYDPDTNSVAKVTLRKVLKKDPYTYTTESVEITAGSPEKFDIIEGGLDEVRDLGATNEETIIEGGLDEVQSLAASEPKIYDGGKDG